MIGFPKPEKRATTKRRKTRVEAQRKQAVREMCVDRDGYCRVQGFGNPCDGPSEWCHFGALKRSRTVGQSPERRHTTAGSFMACRKHHRQYDAGVLIIKATSPDFGCDGELWVFWKDKP